MCCTSTSLSPSWHPLNSGAIPFNFPFVVQCKNACLFPNKRFTGFASPLQACTSIYVSSPIFFDITQEIKRNASLAATGNNKRQHSNLARCTLAVVVSCTKQLNFIQVEKSFFVERRVRTDFILHSIKRQHIHPKTSTADEPQYKQLVSQQRPHAGKR